MKRNYILKAVFTFSFVGMLTNLVSAQFEQKVTMNFAIGMVNPVGAKEYIYNNKYTSGGVNYDDAWLYPYLFSNYKNGVSLTGGLQFNVNRFFSLGVGIGFDRISSWKYSGSYEINGVRKNENFLSWSIYDSQDNDLVIRSGANAIKLNNFSIGVFPRFNILYGKRINPYIFTQITFNYTDINYSNNMKSAYVELGRIDEYNSENYRFSFKKTPQNSFGIGLYPGLGFDVNFNQNLGFYLQGGFSFIGINKSDLDKANLEKENFKSYKVEIGVKLSFFKSKDI